MSGAGRRPADERALSVKVDRARWWLLTEQPFYGSLCMSLRDVYTEGGTTQGTAETDGRRIFWEAEWLRSLSDEETRAVLIHETMHVAHFHNWRLPADSKGNIAGDMAINGRIARLQGVKLPGKPAIAPPEWADLAEEEIYNRLPDTPPGGGGEGGGCGEFLPAASDGDGKGGDKGDGRDKGDGKPGPGSGGDGDGDAQGDGAGAPAPQDSLREQWERRVIQAAQAAKALGRGSIPGDMLAELERITAEHVDWTAETADFFRLAVGVRNDWSRPMRRHAHQDVLYPRRRPDDLGQIAVICDTSGSIDYSVRGTGAKFCALAEACSQQTGARMLVIFCDAEIHAEHVVEPGDAFPRVVEGGGGGTDFRPPFERVADLVEQGERVAGVIYLTDLEGPAPASFDLPTLWVCITDNEPPFGRVVRVKA